jgi:hypothetical protein
MLYPRRILGFLSVVFIVGAASAAIAQSAPPSVPSDAYREWPGTPALAARPEAAVAADEDMIDSQGGDAIPFLPLEAQTVGGISYITGGIGDEELAQIKASEHQYNVHLLMNAPGGAFIGDVGVRITDATGVELLSIEGAGPYFYARLAPGTYTLELNGEGEIKKIPVKIGTNTNIKKAIEFKEAGGVITPHQPTATVE